MKKTLKGVKEILIYMSGEEFAGYVNKPFKNEIEYAKSVSFWWDECHLIIGIVQISIQDESRCKIQLKLSNRSTHFQYLVNEQVIAFKILINVKKNPACYTSEIHRLGISGNTLKSLFKSNFIIRVTLRYKECCSREVKQSLEHCLNMNNCC